jgi:hypothetical protein
MSITEFVQNLHAVTTGDFGNSPLEGVDPAGRIDVLASGLLARMAEQCGPDVARAYPMVKPVIDTAIARVFGGGLL